MLVALYNADGSIYHSTKLFASKTQISDWQDQLRAQGENFISTDERSGLLPPDKFFVHVNSLTVRERPVMDNIRIDKHVIKCGDGDASKATGLPRNTTINITMRDGTHLYQIENPQQALEVSIPVPCIWRITIQKWPYQDYVYEIEAIT